VSPVWRGELPPHTRLILASENLLDSLGPRDHEGRRLTFEWGDEKPEGWYEPIITRHDGPTITDYEAAVDALEWLAECVATDEVRGRNRAVADRVARAVLNAHEALDRLRGTR
jgi:hypothetical protein